ncbi:MAG: hypothetical protein GY856_37740 [bacterium]|nr:hypothetical protein [bacterium]
MSKLALRDGDDHPAAAGKHLVDATVLARAERHDGAGYLAGYAVECTMKTLIQLEGEKPRKYKHRLFKMSQDALRFAALPGARSARYAPKAATGHSIYDRAMGWQEALRYRAPGAISGATAQAWLQEARMLYETTIVPMRLDGVI